MSLTDCCMLASRCCVSTACLARSVITSCVVPFASRTVRKCCVDEAGGCAGRRAGRRAGQCHRAINANATTLARRPRKGREARPCLCTQAHGQARACWWEKRRHAPCHRAGCVSVPVSPGERVRVPVRRVSGVPCAPPARKNKPAPVVSLVQCYISMAHPSQQQPRGLELELVGHGNPKRGSAAGWGGQAPLASSCTQAPEHAQQAASRHLPAHPRRATNHGARAHAPLFEHHRLRYGCASR